MHLAGYKPVIEYCGGTEIGGGFLSGTLLQPACPANFSTPTFGANIVLMGPEQSQSSHLLDGRSATSPARPFVGELALVPPMFGTSQRLLNKDHSK